MSGCSLNETLDNTVSSSTEAYSDHVTLSGLLRVKWKAYHTSLFLEPSRVELNKAKILEITNMISNECLNESVINVALTCCPAIRLTECSPKTLLVEVSFNGVLVYRGYFLNWSPSTDPIDRFEKLPILLVNANAKITRIVNNALIKAFDFVITPIFFNALQLSMLFAVYVSYADKEEDSSAKLKFTVPGSTRSGFITTSMRVRDLCMVFEYYNEAMADDDELVSRVYYERLLDHFRKTFKLDLSRAELRQISLPGALATDTGTFRMNEEDVLLATLMAMNAIFSKTVPQQAPSSFPSTLGS